MTLATGFLLFLLGAVALWAWAPELMPFLKGFVVFSLLFWGACCVVVGLSTLKGRRAWEKSLGDSPSQAENDS